MSNNFARLNVWPTTETPIHQHYNALSLINDNLFSAKNLNCVYLFAKVMLA